MNDSPKWQVARLDDIERRGRTIPVREHLGIHSSASTHSGRTRKAC